jgi:mannose-6-phosphate isomerase-like protein (cupin superfamily)
MEFVRPFEDERFGPSPFRGCRTYVAAYTEHATVLGAALDVGGCGPELHYHTSDQFYFVLEGAMSVQLGPDVHPVSAGNLVFVPAGLAHRNWNDSGAPERHLELIVPAVPPTAPLLHLVSSVDEAPGPAVKAYVLDAAEVVPEPSSLPGFASTQLAGPSFGVETVIVNAIEVASGHGGPGLHIHPFDQLYFVLQGELTVEVALERHVVGPESLVVLPAGVPHRQWNEGLGTERHLAVLAPAPRPGTVMDVGVTFTRSGEDY